MLVPSQGFIFWPVGTGDSTTILVENKVVVQFDLRHMNSADEDDDPHTPIVDRLIALTPKVDTRSYLAVFVLTHPDEDHCLGFADLLTRAGIGEIWFTPRVFREYRKDLCDDAKAFRDEAKRRVRKTIQQGGRVSSGDRVRIIGYDDLLNEDEYKGFPPDRLTVPGNAIVELDGRNHGDRFRAFVHSPFKDDSSGERNDTSLGLQVSLLRGKAVGRALLLGDLCYPTIKRIFERSQPGDLKWNILLAPHHCSKSVMYWQEEGEEDESLKQDILDAFEQAADTLGYVVASAEPIPASNEPGDNPPHAKAKYRYQEIAPTAFLCTQEHPSEDAPKPIIFAMGDNGLEYVEPKGTKAKQFPSISSAVAAARGTSEPPKERLGFGR